MARYLFVDGNYFQLRMKTAIDEFYPQAGWAPGTRELARLKYSLGCEKAFYYDSYAEGDTTKQEFIETVRDLEGFHAPAGSLKAKSKGRPAAQKEVDVQLTVDVLTHLFRRNAEEIVLVAGDLDFNPLVTAIVDAGGQATLLYDGSSIATPLRRSADLAMRMSLQNYLRWAGLVDNPDHSDHVPSGGFVAGAAHWLPPRETAETSEGFFNLHRDQEGWFLQTPVPLLESGDPQLRKWNTFRHPNPTLLRRFATLEIRCELEWKPASLG